MLYLCKSGTWWEKTLNLCQKQNNINSIKPSANRSLLTKFLQHKIDIAILSEVWIKPDEQFNFTGYTFVKKFKDKGYRGVGIWIKNEIDFKLFILPKLHPIEEQSKQWKH